MWILEGDGDILRGKRMWLRPGKSYLIGRTKPEDEIRNGPRIHHSSVSRQHVTITVEKLEACQGSLLHIKSKLKIKDEGTKRGTEVDGIKVKEEVTFSGNLHKIKVGTCPELLRIRWIPVVLSFTFPPKETKGGKDPLVSVRARLEDLDIKAVIPYVNGKTSHVVAAKRNTAKGLQALINGKYIVQNSFIDALIYATTASNLDEPESLSPLEEDFDGNWPNAMEHLPAPSKEPGQQPNEKFVPSAERAEIFNGYTFIFFDQAQFANLQAPINAGAGKAMLYPLAAGETTAEQVVRYVKDTAGEEGDGEFEDGGEGEGLVLLRFRPKGFEDWAVELQNTVALTLDHRMIEQNEFLDAILMNDPRPLRRRLPTADADESAPANSNRTASRRKSFSHTRRGQLSPSVPPQRVLPMPTGKRKPREAVKSFFQGFDSVVDPSQFEGDEQASDSQADPTQANEHRDGSNVAMDDDPFTSRSTNQVRPSSKRPAPIEEEDDSAAEEAMRDKLLPAQRVMKRRRIDEEKEARRKGLPIPSVEEPSPAPETEADRRKKQPPKNIVNLQDAIRNTRAAEESKRRRPEDEPQGVVDDRDIEDMRNLAIVEEMPLLPRTNVPTRNQGPAHAGDRWDERWNGRQNFKKFRRRGQGEPAHRGAGSIMIPLEEVRRKDLGIGEVYWQGAEAKKEKKKLKEKDREMEDSQPVGRARGRAKVEMEEDGVEVVEEVPRELADGIDEVVDVEAPRRTRAAEREGDEGVVGKGRRKGKGVGAGKRKIVALRDEEDSDSDSEEDLKFRFKKKRR